MNHEELYGATLDHFLAPVASYRQDASISEIMINGPHDIYAERNGRVFKTDSQFPSTSFLMSAVRNIAEYVGRPIGGENLTMDGRLPDGSRIHVVLPPVSRQGVCVTIRKFREAAFTLADLVEMGSMEEESLALLQDAIERHLNIVVAGGTGTGKTSLLNALSREIDGQERIVVIEESSELKLVQPHTVYLEAIPDATDDRPRVSVRDLFVNALRMRPDRILIGEVRRGEALEMIQAMLSGHSGSLSTLHASSPSAAATRLETLCLQSDTQLPVYVARAQVAAAVDLFVQATRLPTGERCITAISELKGLDQQQNYVWRPVYKRKDS